MNQAMQSRPLQHVRLRRARVRHWLSGNAGAVLVLAVVGFALIGLRGSAYTKTITIDALTMSCVAYSWSLISGWAGYFSFGQIAFYGAGAYATGLLIKHGIAWYLALPISAAAVAAMALPVGFVLLRLRGIYFALGTLALTVALNILALDLGFLGQGQGIFIPNATSSISVAYFVAVGALVIAVGLTAALGRSRHGLRAMAIRDDEDAVQTLGVYSMFTKLLVLSASAGLAALAGGIAGWNLGFIGPDLAFSSTLNIQAIVSAIVGGTGTVWGPLAGGMGIQWIISSLGPQWSTEVGIGLGVLLILLVIKAPNGLVGLANRVGLLSRHVILAPKALSSMSSPSAGRSWRREDSESPERAQGLLDVRGLTVRFRGVTAVSSVDLRVERGEYLALIGANGAGKTTVLNALTAFVPYQEGSILLDGKDIKKMNAVKRARAGIVRTFQIPRLAETLTVWENVLLGALLHSSVDQAVSRTAEAIHALRLDSVWLETVAVLGPGYRRRVELARVIAARPRIVLLDEPMAGMNQEEINSVQTAIATLPDWGVESIVAVEHVLSAIRDAADRMIALNFGNVIAEGEPRMVLGHDAVVTAFLGHPDSERREARDERTHKRTRNLRDEATPGIRVRGLHAGYDRVRILRDIDLEVHRGEIVGVLGASGAGKTTLCRTICNMCTIQSGTVEFMGSNVADIRPYALARKGLAYVLSSRELFGRMTVEDNLRLGAAKMRGSKTDALLADVLLVFPGLEELLNRKAAQLSGGQQQMAAIGRALMREPKLLVLDEPSTGLAPVVVTHLLDSLQHLSGRGMGILVAEQNARATLQVVDRAYVLQEGAVVFSGVYEELAADVRMASAYLSLDAPPVAPQAGEKERI